MAPVQGDIRPLLAEESAKALARVARFSGFAASDGSAERAAWWASAAASMAQCVESLVVARAAEDARRSGAVSAPAPFEEVDRQELELLRAYASIGQSGACVHSTAQGDCAGCQLRLLRRELADVRGALKQALARIQLGEGTR